MAERRSKTRRDGACAICDSPKHLSPAELRKKAEAFSDQMTRSKTATYTRYCARRSIALGKHADALERKAVMVACTKERLVEIVNESLDRAREVERLKAENAALRKVVEAGDLLRAAPGGLEAGEMSPATVDAIVERYDAARAALDASGAKGEE